MALLECKLDKQQIIRYASVNINQMFVSLHYEKYWAFGHIYSISYTQILLEFLNLISYDKINVKFRPRAKRVEEIVVCSS